ncbi:MAG: hypothetical protein GY716_05990 [bacterium]|nr:hypothetical protein [bacterium]
MKHANSGCRLRSVAVAMALVSVIGSVLAADADSSASPPETVYLFKSGHAWLQRSVSLEPDRSPARIPMPPSVHGSVWIGAASAKIERAVARFEENEFRDDVIDTTQLLRLAQGERVRLDLGDDEWVEGQVLRLLEAEPQEVATAGTTPVRHAGPRYVTLQSSSGMRVVEIGAIKGFEFDENFGGDWKVAQQRREPVLEIEWVPDGRSAALELNNLAGGLTWAPSYALELGEDDRSRLSGKAVVVNDLEDLVGTTVKLVVGYPHIEFAAVRSALMPSVRLETWSNQLQRIGGASQSYTNAIMRQEMAASPARVRGDVASGVVAAAGQASEDLYIYDIGSLDLERGARAYVPLSDEVVEHQHRFDWTVPDTVRDGRFDPNALRQAPSVWHVLRLVNAGSAPWTTAPILVLGEIGPIAQSRIDYTPAGGDTVVRLTEALDLAGNVVEVLDDADQAARKIRKLFGYSYEQLTVLGQLELVNHSRRAAPMRVVKSISGDIVEADHDPRIEAGAVGLGAVNARRTMTWEFELAAGESWKAEYRYHVLIRR